MRLFVSIDIPAEIKQNLTSIYAELNHAGAKTTPFEQLHVTLCFIGEVQENQLAGIIDKLSQVSFTGFQITVSGLGGFPSLEKPRIVWLGLQSNELTQISQDIHKSLGITQEREFHPHVTIARISKPTSLIGLKKYQRSVFGAFKVDGFDLKQSILTNKESTHSVKKTFKTRVFV